MVTARVERAISQDGRIVLPGGTVLQGRVSDARGSGRVSGRARVAIDFDRIVVRGRTQELEVSPVVAEAPGRGQPRRQGRGRQRGRGRDPGRHLGRRKGRREGCRDRRRRRRRGGADHQGQGDRDARRLALDGCACANSVRL
jgi:hypothetical protein